MSNPKPDLHNTNAHIKFGETNAHIKFGEIHWDLLIIILKLKYGCVADR